MPLKSRRVLGFVSLASAILLAACGGDDRPPGGDGSGGLAEYWCVCNADGMALTVDQNPDPTCESACASHGGVQGYVPVQNVTGSAECEAFCAKVEALDCGPCDRDFHCQVEPDSCEAAKRAQLQCEADTGTFVCDPNGSGWSASSSCSQYPELCTPDGGAPDGG
jgi:hypothetical protein